MKIYSVGEVSELLQISKKEVHRLVREERLSCIEITNRRRRFTQEHIDLFLAEATRKSRRPKRLEKSERSLLPLPKQQAHTEGGVSGSTQVSPRALHKEMRNWR